ncbi:zinc-binding protein A33-like isoform X2 [Protopterus annectens]|uniref:zinc-binding protein A33-like isoform X2 n=1 Tax=Protopterus annectens TaxID=7888 RepID=UPI001CFB6B90|nr:zinc-binding protein A33-like isoform X2 [Protopterus annectens]
MAAGKLLHDLAEDLLCSICLDLFKEAVMLKCGHSFCKSCIDKTWDSQKRPSCPECRQAFPSKKYTMNWQLCKAVESNRRSRQYEKEEIPNQEQETQNLLGSHECSEHKEVLKGFCQHDGCPVCVICMMSSAHKGHTFLPILEAASKFQDKLKSTVSSLEVKAKYLKKCQSKQEQNISGIKNEAQNLEQHITSEFAKLRQFLQDKEQQLVQQLKKEAAGILEKMTENLEKIEEMNKAIQKDKSNIESTLQQEDSVHLLKGITDEIKSVMKRLEEEEKEDIQRKKRKGVFNGELISGSLSLGVYRGPLQYSIWKEMQSVIKPGLSHLTLDPITANPRLTLSDDFTSLKHGSAKWRPENPKRYDSYLSALGWQGFTSGRHYWEVEVGCTTEWELGVTRESSNRKGLVAMKPKDGYWVISLWNEMDWSLHSSDQLLRLSVKPRKIGVYLDYEGGQVSFYSADNMSHIYTFTDTFTETLYPYFGIGCYSKPLNLFHLKL